MIFLLLPTIFAQTFIELGKTYQEMIRPWQGEARYRIYTLNLTEIIEDADLVLVARALNSRGDPNIYVSNKNAVPLLKEDAEIVSCASRGLDICIVDKSLLKTNLTYYIGVVCDGFCRFSFKAMYDKEKQMTNNDDLEFRFNQSDNAGIVSIFNNLTGTETSLDIIVEIRNVFELEEAFNSYLSIGSSKPNSDKYNYKGVDGFGGIQVISISGQDLNEKLFTLVVEAQEGALISIRTRCYGLIRDINTYESVEVTLKKDQSQIFKIEISQYMSDIYSNDEAINFSLSPFSGYAYLFVNPDTQPPILDSYRFSYKDSIGDDLVITKKELEAMKVRGDVFYIVVYGVTEISSSMLKVQLVNKNNMLLELNKPTSGKLAQKEIISYQFRLQGPKDHEVQISLKTFQQNSDIIVKQCDNYDCNVTQDDINKKEEKYKTTQGQLFLYSQSQGDDFLVFNFDSAYCNSLFQKYCLYVVGIYPDEKLQPDQFASYQILVTFREHRKRLKENTPYKEFLAKDLVSYFKFTILEGDNAHRLSFILTPIQGQPQMYISQTEKKPSKDSFEAASGFDNVINFGGRQQGPVKPGDYYIAVVGQTASIYLLTAQVFRQWTDFQTVGKYPWQYIQIFEGDPHFYKPNSTQDIGLFKIDLNHYKDQQYDYKQNVRIELICDLDQYELYASDQPEVDASKSRWKAINNEILIDQMDKEYPQIVYLKIVPKQIDPPIVSYQEYNVLFQVGDYKTIDLVIGQSYYDYIKANQIMYFQVPYHNHQNLIVQKQVHGLGQLAVEAIIQYGSQSDFMLDKSSLVVNGSSLETDNCKPTPQQQYFFCYIYIQLTGKQNASFSLLVYTDSTNLELQEGYQIVKKVPEFFDKFYFYVSYQFAEIIVQSIYTQLTIYATIEVHTNTSNLISEDYPTAETAQIQSRARQYYYDSSLFISQDNLEQQKCFEPGFRCVIKVSVYRNNTDKIDKEKERYMEYSIVYKSRFQPIWPNQQTIGACENNTYTYYQLDVPSNETFMIIVTPLGDGDPDLYLKKNQLPTKDSYDFCSAQWAGDQLIIEQGNRLYDNAGTYYIGVYSAQNMTFTIQVRFGNLHYYRVYSSVPFNIILQAGGIAYFDFLNYDDRNFRILLSSNNGRPKMYIDTYTTENELQNSLNKQLTDFNINNNKNGFNNYYQIDRSNKFYASNIHFLVAVTVEVDTDFTILINPVSEPIYLTNNLIQYNELAQGEKQMYKYFIEGNFEVNVDLREGRIKLHYIQNDTITEEGLNDVKYELYDADEIRSKGGKLHNFFKVEYDSKKSYVYTILVVSEKASKFDLWVRSYKTQQELKVGVPFAFWLLKQDNPRVFMFRLGAESKKQKFSVAITNNNQDYTDRSKSLQHPIVEVLRDEKENTVYEDVNHEYYKAAKIEEVSTELSHYVEFEDVAGLYYIRISTQANGNQEYTITIGDNLIGVLAPQIPRTVYGAPGFIHPWEVYIPYGKKLYVTVELCGGQVGVYGSKDKNKIKIGLFEKSLDHAHNKMLSGFFDPGEGVYYIGSKLLKAYHNQDKAAYEIMGQLMDRDKDDPATYFEPGEEGELTWTVDENNYLNVTFSPITQLERDGKSWAWQRVDYYLVTQIKQVDDESPINYCMRSPSSPNIRIIKNALYKNNTVLGIQLDFKPDQQTQFSVVARVYTSNDNFGQFEVNLNYQQAYVNFTHLQNFRMRRIFRYVIPIIFIIGVCLIAYLWNSNRKLKKMLKYEMQDPENRIQPILNNNAVESAIEMNYRGLQDQK